jgi:hypothetical protein
VVRLPRVILLHRNMISLLEGSSEGLS